MLKRLLVLCFVFLASSLVANAQEANVYVTQLKTANQVNYNMGDTVYGNFNIYNTADVPQSDLFIKISIYFKSDKQGVLSGESIPLKDLYLEAHSKKTIPFEYKLPKETAGEAMLTVQAYTSDGTIKGEDSVPIPSVTGTSTKTLIDIKDSYLMLNNNKFSLQVGPTVLTNDNLHLSFSVGNLDKTYEVKPILTIYNRTSNSKPISSIPQDAISLKSNGKYNIGLSTNLDPLVYEGVLSFESNEAQIQPIAFRYITKGDIGTIINANTDVLGGEKGSTVNVKVSYGGNPIAFNLLNGTSTETSIGSDATAVISVSLLDKDGNVLGNGESTVNLKNTGDVTLPITLNKSVDKFSIIVVMKEGDKVLSKYNVQLPTKEKGGLTLAEKILFSVDILIGIVILALLLAYKKNKNKAFLIAIIVLAVLIAGIYTYQKTSAFTILMSNSSTASPSAFTINSITSPLPNDVGSYAPNEEFTLRFNATFGACSNEPWSFSAYGPIDTWWEHDIAYYQSVLNPPPAPPVYVHTVGLGKCPLGSTCSVYSRGSCSSGSCVKDQHPLSPEHLWIGNISNLTIFTSTNSGQTGNATQLSDNGYYSSSGNGHWFYIPTFYIQSKTYKMPSTPGIYDFVFMTTNSSSGTYDEGYRVASQKVCVRGAGLCLDENTNFNVCGPSEIALDQGLDANSPTICKEGSNISNFSFDTKSKLWSWKCTTSDNSASSTCSATCGQGLTYCPDTKQCSATCNNPDANVCGPSEIALDQGLTSTSTNLCVAGQTSSKFVINPFSSYSIYNWECTSSTNTTEQCKASCALGLNYCADTNTCSSKCSNGDKCSLPGIQTENSPIYALLGCGSPTLTLSVKFNKPYANDTTSKCSVAWSTVVKPSTLPDNYTTCKLDGVLVADEVSDQSVSIGQHNLVCETKVKGDDFDTNPESFVTSGPVTKSFKCSRVPVSGEN